MFTFKFSVVKKVFVLIHLGSCVLVCDVKVAHMYVYSKFCQSLGFRDSICFGIYEGLITIFLLAGLVCGFTNDWL